MEVTELNFKQEVLDSKIPVIVDFWADWCMPCKMIAPSVEEISKEYAGKIKVVSLNVDENQNIAIKYGIMSIPTLNIFVNGKVEEQIIGAVPKRTIVSKIQRFITPN